MFNVTRMGLGSRIRHYRTKAKVTLGDLANLSGVDTGTISALELRDSSRSQYFPPIAKALGLTVEELDDGNDYELIVLREPDSNHPYKIIRSTGNVAREPEPRWADLSNYRPGTPVMDGMQRIPAALVAESPLKPIHAWEHEEDLPAGEFVMVPRLDVKLSAGPGSGANQLEFNFDDAQLRAYSADWIRRHRLKPKKLRVMKGTGRSMEPTIFDGDDLLINLAEVEPQDGKVYALWYEGGERVKRLYRMPGGGLRIRSDNDREFPEILLGPEYAGHVRVIGRVIDRSGPGGL